VEAAASYQAVAEGHPLLPEAPAAVYLAGVGLFEQGRHMEAAGYFQLLLDRYAGQGARYVFANAQRQELMEAGLCLLQYSYHQAGEYGLMAGAPHLALQKMPPSGSLWRAYTLLLDADALAAVDRYVESQETLATLQREYPDHPVGVRANRLLAWTYARQGRQDLAIETERALLARFDALGDTENLSGALLTVAHAHFNAKRYDSGGSGLPRVPAELQQRRPELLTALYQEGLCYVRLDRAGDAVDTWAQITSRAPTSAQARKAWLRTGDILFQAAHFDAAREQFTAMKQHFPDPEIQAAASLRLARCDHNQGRQAQALAGYRQVRARHAGTVEAEQATEGITQILYALGRNGDEQALKELFANHPDSPLAPEAGFELALIIYEAGDYEAAAEAFSSLFAQYPGYSAADRHLWFAADCLEKTGQAARAEQSWQNFLAYFPHSDLAPGALLRVAGLRFQDGRYHLALSDYEQVLQMPAENEIHAAAWYNLASCHRILGCRPGRPGRPAAIREPAGLPLPA
jgi:TolA-binding protein